MSEGEHRNATGPVFDPMNAMPGPSRRQPVPSKSKGGHKVPPAVQARVEAKKAAHEARLARGKTVALTAASKDLDGSKQSEAPKVVEGSEKQVEKILVSVTERPTEYSLHGQDGWFKWDIASRATNEEPVIVVFGGTLKKIVLSTGTPIPGQSINIYVGYREGAGIDPIETIDIPDGSGGGVITLKNPITLKEGDKISIEGFQMSGVGAKIYLV